MGARPPAWLLAPLLLLLPAVAMLMGDEVRWGVGDFVLSGALLAGAGLAYEWLRAKDAGLAYRAGAALALVATLLLIWLVLAVGLIGSADDPANRAYLTVLAVGTCGVAWSRRRAWRLMWTLLAMACAQAAVGAWAIAAGLGRPASGALELLVLHALFAGLFAVAAALFGRAAAAERRA